jgi:hypothetical protein
MPGIGVKFDQFLDGGVPQAGDQAVGLRNGQNYRFDISSIGGFSISKEFTQVAHGFSIGEILRLNGAVFVLAQADMAANADVVGIVSAVTDADNFVLLFGGFVENLIPVLAAGTVYFLDAAVAGAMTAVPPAVIGQVRKPLLIAYSTSTGFWLNYNGQII